MKRSRFLLSGFGLAIAFGLAACGEPTAFEVEETTPSFSMTEAEALRGGGSGGNGLLVCPTGVTRVASRVIGPQGGTVSVAGHSVTLSPGAVRRPTLITLIVPASRFLEVDLRAAGQEHYSFAAPVEVTVSYERCARRDVERKLLSAWFIDPVSKEPIAPMPSHHSREKRTVTFTTTHFSNFAIAN